MRTRISKEKTVSGIGGRAFLISLAAMLSCPVGSAASPADRSDGPDPSGWAVQTSEFADLWFGALATIGYQGMGPAPLYEAAHVRDLRSLKEAAGVHPTALDRERARLGSALRGSEAFEVLHFVPVYFAGVDVESALEALDAVARTPSGVPTDLAVGTRFGGSVVASVLASRDERAILGELVSVLREEIAALAAIDARPAIRDGRLEDVRRVWNDELAPRLASYLTSRGLQSGRLVVTPTLGREGRFFVGDPSNPADNVVMIGYGADRSVADGVSSIVRELCYPVVREAFQAVEGEYATRAEAGAASDRAATRCGAMLLGEFVPEALPAYERTFGEGGTVQAASDGRSAELDRELDARMRRAIRKK